MAEYQERLAGFEMRCGSAEIAECATQADKNAPHTRFAYGAAKTQIDVSAILIRAMPRF